MFRNVIFLVMVVGAASMAGWFTINREGDQTSIQINRDEIRSDTWRAIDHGREYLDQHEQRLASQQQQSSNYRDDGYGYGQPTYQQQSYQQQNYDQGQYQYRSNQYDQPQYDRSQYGQPQYDQSQYGQPQYRETDYQQGGQAYRGNYQDVPIEARGGVRYGVPYQNERTR
jgi:hypothetical protein